MWLFILVRDVINAVSYTHLIEEVTNLTIHKYLAGPLGGEQQMASQIEHNLIDMVIFLRDPQNQQLPEPDIFNVMHLCDVHNIPPVSYTHLDVYKRQL